MVRLAQISDTHIGITTPGQLRVMFKELAKEDFDVLVHCGDYSGERRGHTAIKRTVELMSKYFPDKPIITTVGNHDYWCQPKGKKGNPRLEDYVDNLNKISETFETHNIHWLDRDGVYMYGDVVFIGTMGWYKNPNPPTNDKNFLPIGIEGDTDKYLLHSETTYIIKTAEKELKGTHTPVVVTHFPIINPGNDFHFDKFSWDTSIGDYFKETFNCKYFLNGHAHQLHTGGSYRYECGSDYYKPRYQIIEVI